MALTLAALVVYQLVTLRRKLRAGVFGAKLTLRLVLLFALMAVLPGALIYAVSVQFLAKGIESWFESNLDRALESGLNLGRGVLDNMLRDLTAKGDAMALALSARPPSEHIGTLTRFPSLTLSVIYIALIARVVEAERHCCRFFRFGMMVEPDGGPVFLDLSGPPGTRDFVSALIEG